MNARLTTIANRRAALAGEIAEERERTADLMASLRAPLAVAAVGLLVGGLLRRSRRLRRLGAGGALLAAALPFVALLVPSRR